MPNKNKSNFQRYKILVLPDNWIKRWKDEDIFEKLFSIGGEVFREQDGRKTFRFNFDECNYFAKMHRGVGWKEIIKNLFQLRLPVLGAQNEWQALQRLDKIGIPTMTLVAYGKKGWNPARIHSFVITEELMDKISLEDFCRDWPESPPSNSLKQAFIHEVSRIARGLHENGINHRDFYLCHFLLDNIKMKAKDKSLNLKLHLIDLHRAQIRRRVPERWRIKDIAGLYFSSMDIGLSRRDLLRFIRTYEGRPLKDCLKDNSAFWRCVKKRGQSLYRKIHGKEPEVVC